MKFLRREIVTGPGPFSLAGLVLCCSIGFCAAVSAQTSPAAAAAMNRGHEGMVSVKSTACGPAAGDGSTDDTAAINSCLKYAKEHGLSVYFPSGTYRVTSPLDCTVARFPRGGLWLIGDARGRALATGEENNSTILDALTAPGPVIDCGGDTDGGITNLTITTKTTRYQGTASTAGILVSQGGSGNLQGGQLFQLRHVTVAGSGDCSACAAIAMPGVDEVVLDDVITNGGSTVLGWGLGRSNKVSSTFYDLASLLPNLNPTRVTIQNSHLGGNLEPPIQLTGSDDNDLFNVYAATTESGAAQMAIEITTPSGIRGVAANAIHFYGLRTENQSHANQTRQCEENPGETGCGMQAIVFGSRSVEGVIDGQLCTDRAGSQIATEGRGAAIESQRWGLGCAASTMAGVLNISAGYQFSGDDIRFGGPVRALGKISRNSIWMSDTLYLPNGTPFTSDNALAEFPSGTQNVFISRGAADYAESSSNWFTKRR